MFGVLGQLFGSAEAGKTVLDGVVDGVDKLFYTDEEKSEDAQKARTEGFNVYMKWLESTSGSRVARRLLAIGAFSIWAAEHLAATAVRGFAIFVDNPEMTAKLLELSTVVGQQAAQNNTLVGLVFAFYFGGPVVADSVAPAVKNWMGRNEQVKE